MRGLARSSHCRRRRACYDGAKFPRFPSVHVTETHTPHRQAVPNAPPVSIDAIHTVVADALASTPFIDIHTHLYPPSFGDVGLWGIDALLTYHYLEAEVFRSRAIRPEEYWTLSTPARADVIWRALFIEETPVSEAARGVVAVLARAGPRHACLVSRAIAEVFSRP